MADELMDEAKRMRELIRSEVIQEVFNELTKCEIIVLHDSEGRSDGLGMRRTDLSAALARVNAALVTPE